MALSTVQRIVYTETADIWRATNTLSGSKMTGKTYSRVATGVPMYFETGQSQKGVVQFIQGESDNLFTFDTLHMEDGVELRAGDWIRQTAGNQVGEWWQARGDLQVRNWRANKQKVLAARMVPPAALGGLTVPPSPPAGLVAVASPLDVALTWEEVPGSMGYTVWRSETPGGPYEDIATPTLPTYTDTDVVGSTTYYYVVTSVNSEGESDPSNEATATPGLPAPTGLVATGSYLDVVLTWAAVTGAAGYRVLRGSVSGGPYTEIAAPTSPAYTDAAVVGGSTYFYVVTANNAIGPSPPSAQATATVTALLAPTGLSATPGDLQVSLAWAAVTGAAGYKVWRGSTPGGVKSVIATPTTPSYLNTGLVNGTAYYYVVTATNATSESAPSSEVTATPDLLPLLLDTFTDLDGTSLAAHTMDIGPGWTVHQGAVVIAGNLADVVTASGPTPAVATADSGSASGTLSMIVYHSGTASGAGPIARFTSPANCWVFHIESLDKRLFEINGGVYTVRAAAASLTGVYRLIVRLIVSGTSITAEFAPFDVPEGVISINYGSATFNQTATRWGFYTETTASDFEDFELNP